MKKSNRPKKEGITRRKASKAVEKPAAKTPDRIMKLFCWCLIPTAAALLLVLDGLCLYTFNDRRLLVLGMCLAVLLLPFFSEITVKNLSFKREKEEKREREKESEAERR